MNKTEKATPYKLQKAKEKGQVNKSIELNSSIFLLVLFLVGRSIAPTTFKHLIDLIRSLFYLAPDFFWDLSAVVRLEKFLLSTLIGFWFVFALGAMLTSLVISLSQTGFIWSIHPLLPTWKRLNFVENFKRFFCSRPIFDSAKTALKLGLFYSLALFSLSHELPSLLNLIIVLPPKHPALILQLHSKILLQLLALLVALGLLDKLYNNWKFHKEQRMSKQELKDEHRQREGDPKIKAKIKFLQYQLLQKTAALELVKTADVVITNPQHLAIALKYDRHSMSAPKVVCKAKGEFAKQVKSLALNHHVPIIEDKVFAGLLFEKVGLNQYINQEFFPTAASIYQEIYRQQERNS